MKKTLIFVLVVILFLVSIPTEALAGTTLYYIRLDKSNFGELKSAKKITDLRFFGNGTETVDLMLAEPNPAKNYYFLGWQDVQSKQMLSDSVVTVPQQIKDYKAIFGPNGYKITFDTQGGSSISPITGSFGDKIETKTTTLDGYLFGGWYLNAACTGDAVTFPFTIKANTTLFAKWTQELATNDIRFFDENGVQLGETQKINQDSYATAPVDPIKDGYFFTGWKNGTELLSKSDIDALKVTASADYTATFKINQYDVKFFDENGSPLGETQKVNHNSCATAPVDPIQDGYSFTGWKNVTELLSKSDIDALKVTASADYTATFEINQYDVRFYDDNGTPLGSDVADWDTAASKPADPQHAGHTFTGWALTGDNPLETDSLTNVQENLIATAVYAINDYTITFDAKGGSDVTSVTQNYDTQIISAPITTKPGHTLGGWFTDEDCTTGNEVIFPYTIKDNATLYAKWTVNTYDVKFYAQDGTTQIGTTQTVNWGGLCVFETAPAITGYAFDQWVLIGSDGAETDSLTNVKENLKAVASYIRNGCTVTFLDYRGEVIGTDGVLYGDSAQAPQIPIREGYTFTGWDIALNNVTGNMTATAQYAINTYTVRFVDYDGIELGVQTVNWNTAATAPAIPARTGYTFTGWDTGFNAVTGDLLVTAQYCLNAADNTTSVNTETNQYGSDIQSNEDDSTDDAQNENEAQEETDNTDTNEKRLNEINSPDNTQAPGNTNPTDNLHTVSLADEPIPGTFVDASATIKDEDIPRSAPLVWPWLLTIAIAIGAVTWFLIFKILRTRGRRSN